MITIKVQGDNEIKVRLGKVEKQLLQPRDTLKSIGKDLIPFYRDDVFNSEGSALHGAWKALSPKYKAWKDKHYPGRKKLVLTGKMKGSFKDEVTTNRLTILNTDNKFKFHQLGTRKMAQRQMLGINERVINIVKGSFEKMLKNI